ncbi:tRNA pseudouridine(55) synthase TruB, partial [Candidatus Latescibacterota bacterium]
SVCYPFFTLEPLLPRLGQPSYVRTRRVDTETQRQHNRLLLGGMDLPAVAELGRAEMTAAEADSLQQGDVIRLSTRTTDPVRLYVGEKAKFLGWPHADEDGDLKLRLAGRVPPHARQRYEPSRPGRQATRSPVIGQSWLPAADE